MRITPAISSAGTAVLGMLLLAPAAFAAGSESTPLNLGDAKTDTTSHVAGSSGSSSIVRTIVGLAVVIGVIYGLSWVLKQVKKSREDTASGDSLQPLATLPLGTNRSLHLVRAGEEVVLLGVGESGVTPIRTYGENEARALGLIADEPPAGNGNGKGDGDADGTIAPAAPAALPSGSPSTNPFRRTLDNLRSKTVIR
jgi:flagellar protein FliO/FliZ